MAVITPDTFDPLRSYIGVRLQQGVPLVDADWNEAHDVRKFEVQAFLKWFVGNGVPEGNDGFRIAGLDTQPRWGILSSGAGSARHLTERITWSGDYGTSGAVWWMGWTSSSPRISTFAPSRCMSTRVRSASRAGEHTRRADDRRGAERHRHRGGLPRRVGTAGDPDGGP